MTATRQRGCQGVIKVKAKGASGSAATFHGVNTWEFTETAEREEADEIGACAKTYVAGSVETNGVINYWSDHLATGGQGQASISNEIDMEIYPAGTGSGSRVFKTPASGALILEHKQNGGTKGAVAGSFNFTVSGAMTATTVP